MESQTAVWDLDSQNYFDVDDQDMPAMKRQRRNSKNARRSKKVSIPLAIRNRGTPSGYYEIPVRTLIKIYGNTSTGLWNTTQTTGAPSGLTGYRGFGIMTYLDYVRVSLGEGSTSANIDVTIPGYAQLQAVFDEVKIAEMEIQYWYTNNVRDSVQGTGNYGAVDIFTTVDTNGIEPPSLIDEIMQYSNVKRITGDGNRLVTQKWKPTIRIDGATADTEAATGSTNGVVQPSTYIMTSKPAVAHYGVRGWVDVSTASTSHIYSLNILVKQVRRYKMNK